MERQHGVKGAARPASNYETKAEKGGLCKCQPFLPEVRTCLPGDGLLPLGPSSL